MSDAQQTPRHGRLRQSHASLFILRIVAIGAACVLVASASVAAVALGSLSQEVTANAVDISNGTEPAAPPPQIGSIPGGFNVLIVGSDNDKDQGDAFGERDADLNDVNILLHVSEDQRNAVVVSFPRDLVIPHPECTDPETGETFDAMSARPLNDALERGGLGCVTATISQLTGLDIPYAGLVSFNGVIAMSDAVGGVPVCLEEPIADPYSGLDLPAGTSVISGTQALAFLRSRHGVGDGGDLSRISSQQSYLSSLMRKIRSEDTLTDIGKLYGLARAATQNIKLSTSLASLDSMVSMALALKDVDLDKLVFVQYPTLTDPDDANRLVPDSDLAAQLFGQISADQPFTLGADAMGPGATAAPGDPAAPAPVETTAPDAPSTDAPPAPPTAIDGIKGQTAAEQTCAIAFSE
ncbi:LCP family protein [Compostimonas suwonensis]|uniref:LCP family protein required for cell wall assembly n=1 Tax=Compostimonas suwonensis TaxID=1048394 RepID=A0A2M9C3C0_9MICO|nr:LCP family protein [Compostimonas suwonensis]PJJ65041.1 LCP family protein required for cell wall assembly [Compostimonas suwonensis]